jgi:Domain of unknown function (DUF1883)
MKFLHYEVNLNTAQAVRVTLNRQANVRLLDSNNFQKYRNGKSHDYYGGLATHSPMLVRAPHSGDWHVVIDLGGYAGSVSASVDVV